MAMDKTTPNAASHPIKSGGTFAILTSDEPRFKPLTEKASFDDLIDHLKARNFTVEQTHGKYDNKPERSLIVHDIPRDEAMQVGRTFGQESVVWSKAGQHQLVYADGPNAKHYHPTILGNPETWLPGDAEKPDNFTSVPGVGLVRFNFDFDRLEPINPITQKSEYTTDEVQAIVRTLVLQKAWQARDPFDTFEGKQVLSDHLQDQGFKPDQPTAPVGPPANTQMYLRWRRGRGATDEHDPVVQQTRRLEFENIAQRDPLDEWHEDPSYFAQGPQRARYDYWRDVDRASDRNVAALRRRAQQQKKQNAAAGVNKIRDLASKKATPRRK